MAGPKPSGHHRDLLGGPGDAGIEPAGALLAEHEAFVEQVDTVPLAALRLVDGKAVSEGKLVELAPLGPAHRVFLARKERLVGQHLSLALALVGTQQQAPLAIGPPRRLGDNPDLPVEQLLARIVSEAHHAVAQYRLMEGQ